jgi:hypothetical protein
MPKYLRVILSTIALAGVLAFAGACSDDDGDDEASEARNLAETLDNFKIALASVNDIELADDDQKEALKDDCGELQDGVDNDDLDEFCDDLGAAVDDEDQQEFAALKTQFSALEPAVRTSIQQDVGEAIDEQTDDDEPLEGGDPGSDDDDDEDDAEDDPDLPLEDDEDPSR